jgi:hypothetical protein
VKSIRRSEVKPTRKLALSQEILKNLTSNASAMRFTEEDLKSTVGFPRCTPMAGAK